MKKMGKILPVEAVVGAAMLKNKGWHGEQSVLKTRLCTLIFKELEPTGIHHTCGTEHNLRDQCYVRVHG